MPGELHKATQARLKKASSKGGESVGKKKPKESPENKAVEAVENKSASKGE